MDHILKLFIFFTIKDSFFTIRKKKSKKKKCFSYVVILCFSYNSEQTIFYNDKDFLLPQNLFLQINTMEANVFLFIRLNRDAKQNLEMDWSDKKEALEIETKSGSLRNHHTNKQFHDGAAKFEEM